MASTSLNFYCTCILGYTKVRLSHDDRILCSTLKGCHYNNGGCSQNCLPVSTGRACTCFLGYDLQADGISCASRGYLENINKTAVESLYSSIDCNLLNGLCEHECVRNPDRCTCPRGYILSANGRSCLDVDECTLKTANCLPPNVCINTAGNYSCISLVFKKQTKNPLASAVGQNEDAADKVESSLQKVLQSSSQLQMSFYALLAWLLIIILALVVLALLTLRKWKRKNRTPSPNTMADISDAEEYQQRTFYDAGIYGSFKNIQELPRFWEASTAPSSSVDFQSFVDDRSES